MTTQTLPGVPPVPLDSSNSRQHRQQLASALNALNKQTYDSDGTIRQTVVDLSTSVTEGDATLAASISSEASVRATADSAMASDITTLKATVNNPTTGVAATASALSTLSGTVSSQGSTISSQGSAITSLSSRLSTTNGNVSANASAISGLNTTVTSQGSSLSALSSSVSTLSTTVAGHTTTLSAYGSSISGLQAQWGVKIDTDGTIIGAVQLNGVGSSSTFKVTASDFQIVETGSTTPAFEIVGGAAYLNVPLKTNAVGNGNITDNSTANNLSDTWTNTGPLAHETYTSLGSVTVDQPLDYSPIFIVVQGAAPTTDGSNSNFVPYLFRDGVQVPIAPNNDFPVVAFASGFTPYRCTYMDASAPAGSHTYEVRAFVWNRDPVTSADVPCNIYSNTGLVRALSFLGK